MTASTWMMWGLVVFYVLLAGASALEKNWNRAAYWVGATLITFSVLRMT